MSQNAFARPVSKLLLATALSLIAGSVSANTYFTDFENIGGFIPSGGAATDFTVGPTRFTGGMSGVAGIGELYHSGTHAWMVKGGDTGIIQFNPGQYDVSFYAKAFSGSNGPSIINAYDQADHLLKTMSLTASDPFTKFMISGVIDRIEFLNTDSVATQMNTLDDFSVTAVPVPAAMWLFGSAMLGVVGFNGTSRKARSLSNS